MKKFFNLYIANICGILSCGFILLYMILIFFAGISTGLVPKMFVSTKTALINVELLETVSQILHIVSTLFLCLFYTKFFIKSKKKDNILSKAAIIAFAVTAIGALFSYNIENLFFIVTVYGVINAIFLFLMCSVRFFSADSEAHEVMKIARTINTLSVFVVLIMIFASFTYYQITGQVTTKILGKSLSMRMGYALSFIAYILCSFMQIAQYLFLFVAEAKQRKIYRGGYPGGGGYRGSREQGESAHRRFARPQKKNPVSGVSNEKIKAVSGTAKNFLLKNKYYQGEEQVTFADRLEMSRREREAHMKLRRQLTPQKQRLTFSERIYEFKAQYDSPEKHMHRSREERVSVAERISIAAAQRAQERERKKQHRLYIKKHRDSVRRQKLELLLSFFNGGNTHKKSSRHHAGHHHGEEKLTFSEKFSYFCENRARKKRHKAYKKRVHREEGASLQNIITGKINDYKRSKRSRRKLKAARREFLKYHHRDGSLKENIYRTK